VPICQSAIRRPGRGFSWRSEECYGAPLGAGTGLAVAERRADADCALVGAAEGAVLGDVVGVRLAVGEVGVGVGLGVVADGDGVADGVAEGVTDGLGDVVGLAGWLVCP
jgi:hypothetical protein